MASPPPSPDLQIVFRSLDAVPDPVLVLHQGQVVYRNPAAQRALGGELLQCVHREDRAAVERLLFIGGDELAGVRLEVEEPLYRHARLSAISLLVGDTELRQVVVRGEPSAAAHAGRPPGGQGEGLYRTLVDELPYGIYVIDRQGRFTEVNPALERLLRRSARELVGRPFMEVLSARGREGVFSLFQERLASAAGTRDYELTLLLPEGEERIVHVRSTILLQDGEPAGAIGVVRDITEQRQTEAALRSSQQQLALALDSGGRGCGTGTYPPRRSTSTSAGSGCWGTPRARSVRTRPAGAIWCTPTTFPG